MRYAPPKLHKELFTDGVRIPDQIDGAIQQISRWETMEPLGRVEAGMFKYECASAAL